MKLSTFLQEESREQLLDRCYCNIGWDGFVLEYPEVRGEGKPKKWNIDEFKRYMENFYVEDVEAWERVTPPAKIVKEEVCQHHQTICISEEMIGESWSNKKWNCINCNKTINHIP